MSRLRTGGRVGVALAFVAIAVVQLPGSSTAAQGDAPALVELNGVGTSEISSLMTAWAGALYDSSAPTSLSYLPKGDKDSRLRFSRGENDFAITGRPFTEEDQSNLAARDVGVIEAPIAVSAMAFLMSGPSRNPLVTVRFEDPDDPDAPVERTPFVGPLRIPSNLLGRAVLDRGESIWRSPDQLATFAPLELDQPRGNPATIVRSDPSAMNYYLESFVNTFAKQDYDDKLVAFGLEPGVVSESWPLLTTPSRTGDDAIATIVGAGNQAGDSLPSPGGVVAAVSPTAANYQLALQPGKKAPDVPTALYIVNIRNGAGEWVAPTPETITAAAAAGNGAPLTGLTESVPGAYPLTWISSIAAPTAGLTPEKTTALATMIRYAVTEGQNAAAPLGEGRLPAPLVQQSLDAADRIVTSNCTGSDRRLVTVDGGGPSWPQGIAAPATSKICTAVSTPGVTTTTAFVGPVDTQSDLVTPPPTTTALPAYVPSPLPPYSSSSNGAMPDSPYSPYSGELGASDVAVESAAETTEVPADTAAADPVGSDLSVSSVAAELPLDLPGDGRFGLDRLVTAALGGAVFLFARGIFRKRLGGAT